MRRIHYSSTLVGSAIVKNLSEASYMLLLFILVLPPSMDDAS